MIRWTQRGAAATQAEPDCPARSAGTGKAAGRNSTAVSTAELGRGIWGKGMGGDELAARRAGSPGHNLLGLPLSPPIGHCPFPCPKFPCLTRLCSRAAQSRAANLVPRVLPRPQRVRGAPVPGSGADPVVPVASLLAPPANFLDASGIRRRWGSLGRPVRAGVSAA